MQWYYTFIYPHAKPLIVSVYIYAYTCTGKIQQFCCTILSNIDYDNQCISLYLISWIMAYIHTYKVTIKKYTQK